MCSISESYRECARNYACQEGRKFAPVQANKPNIDTLYHANDSGVGMALHQEQNKYKMFAGDTGLFVTLAFWDKMSPIEVKSSGIYDDVSMIMEEG